MHPGLKGIDHVHVYVQSWAAAEPWYQEVLGFKRLDAYVSWAVDGGPLTMASQDGSVHLALFESDSGPTSTIAFGASGEDFLAWKKHLESNSLNLRVTDHKLAYSLYFHDPFDNMHEITTYEHDLVRQALSAPGS